MRGRIGPVHVPDTTSHSGRHSLGDRRAPRATRIRAGLAAAPPEPAIAEAIAGTPLGEPARGEVLAPIESDQEVWASGVTYLRSREAREAESTVRDVYARVYDAARPELFFKSNGWRVAGHQMPIRVVPTAPGTCRNRS